MALTKPFFVSHTGHRFALAAVAYATLEEATLAARRSCGDAMRTTVWDCTAGPKGRAVLVLDARGQDLPSTALG